MGRARQAGVITLAAASVLGNSSAFVPPHTPTVCQGCAGLRASLASSRRATCMLGAGPGRGDDIQMPTPLESEPPAIQRPWHNLKRKLVNGAAAAATVLVGAPALGSILRTQFGIDNAVTQQIAPEAQASLFKKFNKRTLREKLDNVPVFMVVNAAGQPYLTPAKTGEQQGIFFTSFEDAQQMLFEMIQTPSYAPDARLYVLSLGRAYDMVRAPPRKTGFVSDDGVEDTMSFKFHDTNTQRERAEALLLDTSRAPIPVFYADGLAVKKDGCLVRPVFFDPEDLTTQWLKACKENKSMPRKPDIRVYNLPEVILQMEMNPKYKDVGFFPSSTALKFVKAARKQGGTKSRLPRFQG